MSMNTYHQSCAENLYDDFLFALENGEISKAKLIIARAKFLEYEMVSEEMIKDLQAERVYA